jgi:hypothetical protein
VVLKDRRIRTASVPLRRTSFATDGTAWQHSPPVHESVIFRESRSRENILSQAIDLGRALVEWTHILSVDQHLVSDDASYENIKLLHDNQKNLIDMMKDALK